MSRVASSLVLATVVLAGCKTQVTSDVYLTDVAAVAADGKALPVDLKLGFEVPSEDKCAEAKEMLTPTLDKHFGAIEFVGCTTEGFSNFANFTAGSEMVLELENKKVDSDLPIYLGVTPAEGGIVEVGYFSNPDNLKALMADLPDEAKAYSDRIAVTFAATIHNDGTESSKLSVAGVFVNGRPALRPAEIELERRKELAIRLSDVGNATVSAGSWASIATVLPPAKP